MKEKLIDNWLTKTSERGFQAGFCQLLTAKGYEILHSTTHNPLELGKDVIALSPQGVVCSFQLKVYSGKEITQNAFSKHREQLMRMVTDDPPLPIQGVTERENYFVVNSGFSELAYYELQQFNKPFEKSELYSPIKVITKEKILYWIKKTEADLWPSELQEQSILLQMFLGDGTQMLPIDIMDKLLLDVFCLVDTENSTSLSEAELQRRLASGMLLVFIALDKYSKADNHFATISAWSMFIMYAIAACLKNNIDMEMLNKYLKSVNLAIFTSFSSLLEEVKDKEALLAQQFSDSMVKNTSRLLISTLLSIYWLMADNGKKLPKDINDIIFQEIKNVPLDTIYLCEAAVVHYFPIHWYLKHMDPSYKPEAKLHNIISSICLISNNASLYFAPPYYSMEDVLAHESRRKLGLSADQHSRHFNNSGTYTAEPLLLLLVRTRDKQLCKDIWPEYSKLLTMQFETEKNWQNFVIKSPSGQLRVRQQCRTKSWNILVSEAEKAASAELPDLLKKHPHLLLLWLLIAPHRATNEMVCAMDNLI